MGKINKLKSRRNRKVEIVKTVLSGGGYVAIVLI